MGKRPGCSNRVRLIAGRHGGRRLTFPDVRGLRPTADSVRETLFSWLQNDIEASSCLDAFAGSGALGLEAASRGASRVVMLDTSRQVIRSLNQHVDSLGLNAVVQVRQASALSWIQETDETFDIVFLDPPFADQLLSGLLDKLIQSKCVSRQTMVYIERDKRQILPDETGMLETFREKTAGQVTFGLYYLNAIISE